MSSIRTGGNASPLQEDEVKRAADLREWLETKILGLETELSKHREMLAIVDSVLRKTSFVPATELRNLQNQKTEVQPPAEKVTKPAQAQTRTTPKDQMVSRPSTQVPVESGAEQSRALRRSKDGLLMANAFVSQNKVVIVPASDVKLAQTTPPFQSFFINRILKGFEAKDRELSQSGSLPASKVLKYDIVEADGYIERISVDNYRDNSRLNEILNTVSWAFSRMLEKK